ncbi:MAG: anaerobic ribonucleoside-triphosphate reductase [Promethearchaeota archaeon]
MDSDKNIDVLEKQLKILGQKIRIDILKKLNVCRNPLSYSMLQKEVLGANPNSVNFSFHLKPLKNANLISTSENGYILSTLGKQILKNIISMEQILNDQNKPIMIRTSKYSKEPFNANKIEDYLIKEGQLEKFLAIQISKEVKERLSKANINYLTTPLMREYINAILLENGLEEIRHKLTRLGTPPFEAFSFFDRNFNPEQFISKLGSDVSEQFLLLNLLPKNLADLYLSGEIALLNLNYWSLRPLGFYLDSKSIVEYITKQSSINFNKLDNNVDFINLIMNFFDTLTKFKPYFSEDILLGNFNNSFLSYFNSNKNTSNILNIITSQILKLSNRHYDEKPHLSLEFSKNNAENSNNHFYNDFLKNLIDKISQNNDPIYPLILYDYSNFLSSKIESDNLIKVLTSSYRNNFIFYKNNHSNLLNSTLTNVHRLNKSDEQRNKIVLDKILINLHMIAKKSNQKDGIFFENLHEKLDSVFEFFVCKKKLVDRKLKSSNHWKKIISEFFEPKNGDWIDESLKSISFFGLNEAVKTHCGIEIDRNVNSEVFGQKILNFMVDIIDEHNQQEHGNYIFTQYHNENYLSNKIDNNKLSLGDEAKRYNIDLIRTDSKLSLERKIHLYKKFEKILDGGSIFTCNLDNINLPELIKTLINSKLNAFSIRTEI